MRLSPISALSITFAAFISTAACTNADPAASDTQDAPTFEEFRASVYREPGQNGVYVIEDQAFTEADLRDYYDTYIVGYSDALEEQTRLHEANATSDEQLGQTEDALTVNRVAHTDCSWIGKWPLQIYVCSLPTVSDDTWSQNQAQSLTYCISNDFGSDKQTILRAMDQATTAWQKSAGVRFVYRPGEDGNCTNTNDNVVFDIHKNSGIAGLEPPYGARSFYPSMPRLSRQIQVRADQLGNFTGLVSTMTHELGHTLGFVHEQVRVSQAGASYECNWDPPQIWRSVTSYDPSSIMHYWGCNGSVADSGQRITPSDADGARSIYGGPLPGCAHARGLIGNALDQSCSACVSAVCNMDSFCCQSSWDGICVDEGVSICGI